jgi:hypothetical protein
MTTSSRDWGVAKLTRPTGEPIYIIAGQGADLRDLADTFTAARKGDRLALARLRPLVERLARKARRSPADAKVEAQAVWAYVAALTDALPTGTLTPAAARAAQLGLEDAALTAQRHLTPED